MGTVLQKYELTPEDFNGAKGCYEILNETRPDIIFEVHKKYSGTMKQLVIANIPAEEENYAIAFRKNDKELINKINAALDKIKSNGEYDKILKKYFK